MERREIMKYIFFISLLVILSRHSVGQVATIDDCYEIKFLDFFGLDKIDAFKWSTSEISGLLQMDFDQEFRNTQLRTNFLIPMIVKQLKDFHSRCNDTVDTEHIDQLIELYLKIRDFRIVETLDMSRSGKIDFVRKDFYSQISDLKSLSQMIMTFDDGPFYGDDFRVESQSKHIEECPAGFGYLKIYVLNKQVVLTGINQQEDIIFQKLMTGSAGRNISDLHFDENPIQYNSVATIVHLNTEGESLIPFPL